MLEEFQQHRGPIRTVCFSGDGSKLFSASGDGHVCCYDVMHAYTPVKMLSGELPDDTYVAGPCWCGQVSGMRVVLCWYKYIRLD